MKNYLPYLKGLSDCSRVIFKAKMKRFILLNHLLENPAMFDKIYTTELSNIIKPDNGANYIIISQGCMYENKKIYICMDYCNI